jgi:hypothetical protein
MHATLPLPVRVVSPFSETGMFRRSKKVGWRETLASPWLLKEV